ncbi:hypothetical protein K7X08_032169 [Anisodus acutangulus]|uniref:Uncharacterized protein n=1 Tax=Anisodus acutangulus TaxID=402998 RepID=A0A9Q1RMD9_9SOLA|nr:hypothetical protein K7X08_032169 [Anisodus acutangulus]
MEIEASSTQDAQVILIANYLETEQVCRTTATTFTNFCNTKSIVEMITLGGDAELELVDSLDLSFKGVVFSVRPPKKS